MPSPPRAPRSWIPVPDHLDGFSRCGFFGTERGPRLQSHWSPHLLRWRSVHSPTYFSPCASGRGAMTLCPSSTRTLRLHSCSPFHGDCYFSFTCRTRPPASLSPPLGTPSSISCSRFAPSRVTLRRGTLPLPPSSPAGR